VWKAGLRGVRVEECHKSETKKEAEALSDLSVTCSDFNFWNMPVLGNLAQLFAERWFWVSHIGSQASHLGQVGEQMAWGRALSPEGKES
jgi:hypothetical protein